jgi:hypothetical protein
LENEHVPEFHKAMIRRTPKNKIKEEDDMVQPAKRKLISEEVPFKSTYYPDTLLLILWKYLDKSAFSHL